MAGMRTLGSRPARATCRKSCDARGRCANPARAGYHRDNAPQPGLHHNTLPCPTTTLPTLLGPGSDPPAPHRPALAVGARVQEFEIEGLVGEGGFSIVYRAHDTLLGRTIALKEYMPTSLAQRSGARQVQPRTGRHRETFELGLRSFINEARLLASFDHPALVKVYRFWEENGTAYLVMPLYQGRTLREWLGRDGAQALHRMGRDRRSEPA